MDWKFIIELGFWLVVLVIPLIAMVVNEQRQSREREAEARRRERSL